MHENVRFRLSKHNPFEYVLNNNDDGSAKTLEDDNEINYDEFFQDKEKLEVKHVIGHALNFALE